MESSNDGMDENQIKRLDPIVHKLGLDKNRDRYYHLTRSILDSKLLGGMNTHSER